MTNGLHQKINLIKDLSSCNFSEIEVGSLVNSKIIPTMKNSLNVYLETLNPKKFKSYLLAGNRKSIEDINKYFEFKIASVLRDNDNQNIPTSSSIKESGNIIGLVKNKINENLDFVYDFSIDNNLQTIEYNSLSASFSSDKFTTGLKFIEENGKIGFANSIENSFTYEFDENNFLSFNTRRNRKISLTEFYDLIYEYKNDCLTAGIKYKKTYYKDRDLLPSENFMISLTIFPLTTYEKSFDRN